MDYTEGQESPDLFHKWVAITTLATAMGRKLWINRGYYMLYPNLYVILVGESARLRKSVATSIGVGLLRKMKQPPVIFAQKLTQESLIQTLANMTSKAVHASALAYAPELSVFLGSFQNSAGLISMLTTLYDCPDTWVYRTVMRGEDILKYVCMNMLGASTTDWMRLAIPEDAVGGGFTSRVVFICPQTQSRVIAFPEMTQELMELQVKLIEDLNHIAEILGEMKVGDEARIWYEEWYLSYDSMDGSPMLRGYRGRKHDLLLKLAMIRSISLGDSLEIEPEHMDWALDELNSLEDQMAKELEELHLSQFGKEARSVLEFIRRKENVSHSDVIRNCWRFGDAEKIGLILRTLVEARLVHEVVTGVRGRYYKSVGFDKHGKETEET